MTIMVISMLMHVFYFSGRTRIISTVISLHGCILQSCDDSEHIVLTQNR